MELLYFVCPSLKQTGQNYAGYFTDRGLNIIDLRELPI